MYSDNFIGGIANQVNPVNKIDETDFAPQFSAGAYC